jgi:hypothetical protein
MTNPEKASARRLTGKCFCGAVHYAVADEFVYAANCHCSNCRRTTGSAFKPFAGIEREKLVVTKGEDKLMIFGDESGNDTYCRVCGSLLYSLVRNGAFVHVAMGTLIDNPSIRPTPPELPQAGDKGRIIPRSCRSRAINSRPDSSFRRSYLFSLRGLRCVRGDHQTL